MVSQSNHCPESFDSPFVLSHELVEWSKDEWRLRTGSVEGQATKFDGLLRWPSSSSTLAAVAAS